MVDSGKGNPDKNAQKLCSNNNPIQIETKKGHTIKV